jgi:hypothetical protein
LGKTFGLMVKRAGLGDEPRRVFEEIKTIFMVDIVLDDNRRKGTEDTNGTEAVKATANPTTSPQTESA